MFKKILFAALLTFAAAATINASSYLPEPTCGPCYLPEPTCGPCIA